MNKTLSILGLAVMLTTSTAFAGGGHDHSHGSTSTQVAQADAAMTEGEIRKVDKEAKKLTIKHGELKNLGMPAMTMVFQVKDPAVLDKVKVGDKVRFTAEKLDSGITVTALEAAK